MATAGDTSRSAVSDNDTFANTLKSPLVPSKHQLIINVIVKSRL